MSSKAVITLSIVSDSVDCNRRPGCKKSKTFLKGCFCDRVLEIHYYILLYFTVFYYILLCITIIRVLAHDRKLRDPTNE